MTSNDASANWAKRYRDLVRRDLNAGDPVRRLRVARRNLDRSRRELAAGDDDGALIAAEAAMVSAADAVLARDSYRLRGKTGSHEARFAYPGLPPELATEARIAETARKLRNVALYEEPDVVSPSLARDAVAAAARLIEAAERAVNPPG